MQEYEIKYGCDCEFESVADWESDMMQEMAQYQDWY